MRGSMSATGMTGLAIAVLAVMWVAIGAIIAVAAARRYRLAQQVIVAAQANARLIEMMPCRPLLVRPDGSIEVDEPLLRDLGFRRPVLDLQSLSSKDCGLEADDLAGL